jgi:hypothetical protein
LVEGACAIKAGDCGVSGEKCIDCGDSGGGRVGESGRSRGPSSVRIDACGKRVAQLRGGLDVNF